MPLWGNKKCSNQTNPTARARQEGFIDVLPIQALWVLSWEMMQAKLNSDGGCPGSFSGVTPSSDLSTLHWQRSWVGLEVIWSRCFRCSFVDVLFGPVQRNENPLCLVMQFQFKLEKANSC